MSSQLSQIPEQVPARMLNEYAYCPRLFYLEFVLGEWAHSADTLDGRFVHRRVDQEQGALPAADALSDQVKLHSRSVMVGSDSLGAVARCDLIEVDGVVLDTRRRLAAKPRERPLRARPRCHGSGLRAC